MSNTLESTPEAAKARLTATGRNDLCPCGSGKKYKKCHLQPDEGTALPPAAPPDPAELVLAGWRLFEQRRPGAAEKEFRAALKLQPGLVDAQVGIGMARLQSGDNDGARLELSQVIEASAPLAKQLNDDGVKDAFTRKEAQPYVRACHALGCLSYDEERWEDSLEALQRVYSVDEGTVGTEARLIAGKTLLKLGRPAEAVKLLEAASDSSAGGSRAQVGLAAAHVATGDLAAAAQAMNRALDANPHYGKALLGLIRRRVDNVVGTPAGSREEALVYAQTYGDVWDAPAKKWMEGHLESRAAKDTDGADASAPAAG